MANGADKNAKGNDGWTAFMFACNQGDKSLELVKYLMANGADKNAEDRWGWTAFMAACYQGDKSLGLVKWMMANGVDAKAKTKRGSTALSIARNVKSTPAEKLISLLEKI